MFERLGALALACALPVSAATNFYTDATTFDTALAGAGLTPGGWYNFSGAASGTTLANVAGTGVNFSGFIGNSPSSITVSGSVAQITVNSGNSDDRVVITPPANLYAFGIQFTSRVLGSTWCFGLAGGGCAVSQPVSANQTVFFGVVNLPGDGPLPALQLYAAGTTQLEMQQFKLGTYSVAEAPEPSTFALVGGALLVLPLLARRRWRG